MKKAMLLMLLILHVEALLLFEIKTFAASYIPGTYTSSAKGMRGDVTVIVIVDESSIEYISVDVSQEAPNVGAYIGEYLEDAIFYCQSSDFDSLAGASVTSEAAREALQKALLDASQTDITDPQGKEAFETDYSKSTSGYAIIVSPCFIRSKPAHSFDNLLNLKAGDIVRIIQICAEKHVGTEWCVIEKDGIRGYVVKSKLIMSNDKIKGISNAELETENVDLKQTIDNENSQDLLEKESDADKTDISDPPEKEVFEIDNTNIISNDAIIASPCFIRSKPAHSFNNLLELKTGDKVRVIEICAEKHVGTEWCVIEKDGISGYVVKSKLIMSNDQVEEINDADRKKIMVLVEYLDKPINYVNEIISHDEVTPFESCSLFGYQGKFSKKGTDTITEISWMSDPRVICNRNDFNLLKEELIKLYGEEYTLVPNTNKVNCIWENKENMNIYLSRNTVNNRLNITWARYAYEEERIDTVDAVQPEIVTDSNKILEQLFGE